MKTTIDLEDSLLRRAKSAAAERGIPLRILVSEALDEKLSSPPANDKPWMAGFGELRDLHEETVRINQIIEDEFEQIDPEDWK